MRILVQVNGQALMTLFSYSMHGQGARDCRRPVAFAHIVACHMLSLTRLWSSQRCLRLVLAAICG